MLRPYFFEPSKCTASSQIRTSKQACHGAGLRTRGYVYLERDENRADTGRSMLCPYTCGDFLFAAGRAILPFYRGIHLAAAVAPAHPILPFLLNRS
jgi:hypothetical protein